MPQAASKPCTHPGCSVTLNRGEGPRCPAHTKAQQARTNEAREDEYDPGAYGHRWRKARRRFLLDNPWCVEDGCNEPANEVDHVIPHRGDMGVFWHQGNWQALCKGCHSRKTMREIRNMGTANEARCETIVVCGPPGSGKTTLAMNSAGTDDLILDMDRLMEAMKIGSSMVKTEAQSIFAYRVWKSAVEFLPRIDTPPPAAWVIATAPDIKYRDRLRRLLDATVYVIELDEGECLKRIGNDMTRVEDSKWPLLVSDWWTRYERSGNDIQLDGKLMRLETMGEINERREG